MLPVEADIKSFDHKDSHPKSQAPSQIGFSDFEELVDYATKRWREHFVITDIRDEVSLQLFLRRPFALFVSVDAPLLIRFKRFNGR